MRLCEVLDKSAEYKKILSGIQAKSTPINVICANSAQKAHFIYTTYMKTGRRALVVADSEIESRKLASNLRFFMGERVREFCAKEYMYYNADSASREKVMERLGAIDALTDGKCDIITVSPEALLQFTLPKEDFLNNTITFEIGKIFSLDELCEKLVYIGYSRVDTVEGVGQFSIRGGIADIFSPNYDEPVRIEFFDDETDSIRFFDPILQTSIEKTDSAKIIPCRELIYDANKTNEIINLLKKRENAAKKEGNDDACEKIAADIDRFSEEKYFVSDDRYASCVYDAVTTVADYFDGDDLIFFCEPKDISQRAKSFMAENAEILVELGEKNMLPPKTKTLWADYKKLMASFAGAYLIGLSEIGTSSPDFRSAQNFNLMAKPVSGFHGKLDFLIEDLEEYKRKKNTVLILAGAESRGKSFTGDLFNRGIECVYKHDRDNLTEGTVMTCQGTLSDGFEYTDVGFVLISDKEVFSDQKSKKRRRLQDENTNKLRSFTDISPGDYVVHQTHGIGRYEGIKKLTVDGASKDYLKIAYHGTDVLYVSVDQLDMLYKYIGSEGRSVKLNRLGGNEWNKTKQRVKASTQELAQHLIKLYGERMQMKGYAYSPDTPWQREFEDGFGYEETPDQLRSIEEVKADMESDRPMDRLLCGDVGYGKTEVAIRAAFKAVMDSKQVAYLVPTTILAMQHYHTFVQRMENFPVRVEMLSRFKTAAEQKKILSKLKTGEIDIIIGTHRILSKDLKFKDLGLLIIDEEQRFGVGHKEKLKEIRKNVDVLTLTATPIPRTLHMAMVNIRDMSIISQPPQNRYPVQTFVMEHDMGVVTSAIKRELARGGQVYYLYNRVEGIYKKADEIQSLIPEAKVGVGHGKMNEEALERVMVDFMNEDINVLVCTTIIETGLDISNVNTIIIENADKMGLAQLYQLRGRVGRSNRNAYAYLTYNQNSILSDVARKRLSAIREFTEFGSGFKIALRDLEIRGAGNILGAEQHGHMDAVGYDMYCKLLKESVSELNGEAPPVERETTVEINVNAYIPESYIRSQEVRIDIYKRIASINDLSDSYDIEEELEDRFGDIPSAVKNIIDVALVKAYAAQAGICEVAEKNDNIILRLDKDDKADMKVISQVIGESKGKILFSAGANPYLSYRAKDEKPSQRLANIKFLLQRMKELKFS